jgi:integrase
MLELMARSGMRVGEVLKLRPMDIEDRKAIIRDAKSGREAEAVFLPQNVADRLKTYLGKISDAEAMRWRTFALRCRSCAFRAAFFFSSFRIRFQSKRESDADVHPGNGHQSFIQEHERPLTGGSFLDKEFNPVGTCLAD